MANHTIVIIAGEASGDVLGAGLMLALQKQRPELKFEGIGGPQMLALGFTSLVPMERLSVMGLVEVLGRLPELLRLRRRLIKRYIKQPPLAVVGIDAPDFNFVLETKLKAANIPTVHYVSPSVWAWREDRVFTVAKACHRVLALLPFELPYYQGHNIPATFVGHPLADVIPGDLTQAVAQTQLQLVAQQPVLALLPGSRAAEVRQLAPDFLAAAALLQQQHPLLQVVVAAANRQRQAELQEQLLAHPQLRIQLVLGQSHPVLAAADAVLVASGTATLETLLFEKPMLVCYRMNGLSYRLFKRKLKVAFVSLPNLLAGQQIVEELLQDAVQPQLIARKLDALLFDASVATAQQQHFSDIHRQLACGASTTAAQAVLEVIAQQTSVKAAT
ncbi:MAG: lipid-A-disaccharide synthase [Oceanospirillaceae bacterium]|jgi:lipid-A-disaccharide synthase|nr:lipid-A-disaccharide synthase [Oceanospirillaceae bacterium]MBT4442210.1 lipid-A-disaccharide synthase [Oceanospirillaceae bacterium]MBT6076779.1 lipid-A-disaccharide synthase [Oceanospirillaceae bacterium]MBT7329876.1 lipid-A-disaccharide synthase [Oceanospirillaceae bacterium]